MAISFKPVTRSTPTTAHSLVTAPSPALAGAASEAGVSLFLVRAEPAGNLRSIPGPQATLPR